MKIMLGTAQFGSAYGAFNATGQVPSDHVAAMLERAHAAGVRMLDTARAYGESEQELGRCDAGARFDIVTKCPDLSQAADPVAELNTFFAASCAALGVSHVYGYLLHNAADLERPGIWDALLRLRDTGRVERIGISGYDAGEAHALSNRYPLTLIQLPANVLDPWYEAVTFPDRVEVHVRSAFLQGFLLADTDRLPSHLVPWRDILVQFHAEAEAQDLTPIQAALAPLLASRHVGRVVVGADSPAQLDEILGAVRKLENRPVPTFGPFPNATRKLTDPRGWRT